jgi:hypothetical protein
MLANRVGVIPGVAGQAWNGIATTCHFATTFWAFWDEFGVQPTLNDIARIGVATRVVGDMLPFGARLTCPANGALVLTPGSVVVFVKGGEPGHSCVARDANTLAGYNQPDWFAGPGVPHGYTTHNTNELRWRGGSNKPEVQGNSAKYLWCELVAVPEGAAKAIVRKAIQG